MSHARIHCSAAHAGTQYSLKCTRLEPVVVVPIKTVYCRFVTGYTAARIHLQCSFSTSLCRQPLVVVLWGLVSLFGLCTSGLFTLSTVSTLRFAVQ